MAEKTAGKAAPDQKITFCRICEPLCGMVASVQDGRLVALRPDREHPLSAGFACQKGIAFADVSRRLPNAAAHAVPASHRGRRCASRRGAFGVGDHRRPGPAAVAAYAAAGGHGGDQEVLGDGRPQAHAAYVDRRRHPSFRGRRPVRSAVGWTELRAAHR
ncbi:MAG: hypothetical protein ACSLE6_18595 [Mycobacterium sp.]